MWLQEMVNRSVADTHKLDLMAQVSALKLQLATSEKVRVEQEEKLIAAQVSKNEINSRESWTNEKIQNS